MRRVKEKIVATEKKLEEKLEIQCKKKVKLRLVLR